MGKVTRKSTADLTHFANALRDFLDLDPLPTHTSEGRRRRVTEERFAGHIWEDVRPGRLHGRVSRTKSNG